MDQLRHWNKWYDGLPELWRFPFAVAALVLVGAINMALTIASGFPFGLLVLIAIAVLGAIRIPYLLSANDHAPEHPSQTDQPTIPAHADMLHHWNHWYDSFPELWRFQIVVWTLVLVGALNMALTIGGGFPFGLLVLLAVIAICAVRLPYVMGWGFGRASTNPAAADGALAAPEPAPALVTAPLERLEPPQAETVTLHPANKATEPEAPERPGRDHDDVPPAARGQFSPEARPPAA